jgi:hypothetical protein
MLRPDESTAWNGFLSASPLFASDGIANWSDGPDPPDVLCMSASGKTIGVEITKWVERAQVTDGKGRELGVSVDKLVQCLVSRNRRGCTHGATYTQFRISRVSHRELLRGL